LVGAVPAFGLDATRALARPRAEALSRGPCRPCRCEPRGAATRYRRLSLVDAGIPSVADPSRKGDCRRASKPRRGARAPRRPLRAPALPGAAAVSVRELRDRAEEALVGGLSDREIGAHSAPDFEWMLRPFEIPPRP